MPDMDSVRATSHRGLSWHATAVFITVCVFLYYWTLISDGRFLDVEPLRYGLVFNSMIEYMARGRFDVDPALILHEGWLRDGRTYAYFGPVPALLRLPLLILRRYRDVDFTTISCVIGATIASIANLVALYQVQCALSDKPYVTRIMLFAAAMVIFGGAQLQYLRPSIFQESLYWAAAIASIFVVMAFRWCIDASGRRAAHLSIMAVLAGFCLLTRVSTAIGLYAACGGILLTELIIASRAGGVRAFIVATLRAAVSPPSLILLAFAAICGWINYERWGSPLTFQDYRYYNSMLPDDPVFAIIRNYGYFNFRRLWFGLAYFFVPIWTIIGADGHFLFRAFMDRELYIVELPPATFLASDLFLCFLACLGCAWLWRDRMPGCGTLAARLIAVGFALPGLLILIAIAMTFRYRMEFYPLFEFLGLFGLLSLAEKFPVHPRLVTGACSVMVAISIVFSHVFLVGYKVSPWGYANEVEKTGWIAAYRGFLHIKYPALDRYLRAD